MTLCLDDVTSCTLLDVTKLNFNNKMILFFKKLRAVTKHPGREKKNTEDLL
jgi:hypothetical protein